MRCRHPRKALAASRAKTTIPCDERKLGPFGKRMSPFGSNAAGVAVKCY